MALPLKFKDLIELSYEQVERPDSVWLNYAVCASCSDSCGWQGWIIDAVQRKNEEGADRMLPSDTDLNCPKCGKPLFRTEVNYRFELSPDQSPKLAAGVDYEVVPLTYDEDAETSDRAGPR